MTKRKPDPNEEAARIVRATVGRSYEKPPADLEAAWNAWEARIQTDSDRMRELLRAAFEAGYEAGKQSGRG